MSHNTRCGVVVVAAAAVVVVVVCVSLEVLRCSRQAGEHGGKDSSSLDVTLWDFCQHSHCANAPIFIRRFKDRTDFIKPVSFTFFGPLICIWFLYRCNFFFYK